MIPRLILAAIIVPLFSIPAHALGKDGHEAVCYIAYDQVSPQTREKIDTLISQDPEYGQIEDPAEAFAKSCVWADKIKPVRSAEHYVNVPRTTKKITSLDCPEAEKCLLSAIVSDLAILKDTEASDEDKLVALKYMGHWIGDLHQPLHVSFKDDKGGNDVKIKKVRGCKNLHQYWDKCIVAASLGSRTPRQFADDILNDFESGKYTRRDDVNFDHDWVTSAANSSFHILTSVVYLCPPKEACRELTSKDLWLQPSFIAGVESRQAERMVFQMASAGSFLATALDNELTLPND